MGRFYRNQRGLFSVIENVILEYIVKYRSGVSWPMANVNLNTEVFTPNNLMNIDILDLIDQCKTKEKFESVIHTIVMESVEHEYVEEYDDEDDEPVPAKTDDEVLEMAYNKANDALVIMADPLFEFLYELSELYYFKLKQQIIGENTGEDNV